MGWYRVSCRFRLDFLCVLRDIPGVSQQSVTREQAAKRLHCSMRTVERMLRDGRLASVRRADGRLSVDAQDLARVLADPGLLETRRQAPPATPAPIEPAEPTVPLPEVPVLDATRVTPLGYAYSSAPPDPPLRASAVAERRPTAAVSSLESSRSCSSAPRPRSPSGTLSHSPISARRRSRLSTWFPTGSIEWRPSPAVALRRHASTQRRRSVAEAARIRSPCGRRDPRCGARPLPRSPRREREPTPHVAATPTVRNCGFGSLTIAAC